MIKEAIQKVVDGNSLAADEAAVVMEEIMTGEVTPAQFGAFVTALRLKGETVEEISGLARIMREKALQVKAPGPVMDIVGTGGDGKGTFNISTASIFVAAGAGIKVAKHGNRGASSKCGAADVLEALGVKIELTPEQVEQCIDEAGVGFMFAPSFHPAMKYAGPSRREIGIRTVFNILGPLTNPARAGRYLLGAFDADLQEKMAGVLRSLGCEHALVVHGDDGVDEISINGPTQVYEVQGQDIKNYAVGPAEFGLPEASLEAISGGNAEENAAMLRDIFAGGKGPRRDVVLANAGAAIYSGGKASTLREGAELAAEVIDSGKAAAVLERLLKVTQGFD